MSVQENDGHENGLSRRPAINPVIRFAATPLVWINIVADDVNIDEMPEEPEFFRRFRTWMSAEKIYAANVPSSWGNGTHCTAFHKKDSSRVIAWLNSQDCLPTKELEV